jgi:hypothetical protein
MALEKLVKRNCPDCGVAPDEMHVRGCDQEQCAKWGAQRLSCGCPFRRGDLRHPWTGIQPGVEECREYGFFSRRWPGRGYLPCHADDPGAVEDINRLVAECRWDAEKRRFVLD